MWLTRVLNSWSLYPLTAMYAASLLTLTLVVQGQAPPWAGGIFLAVVAALLVADQVLREVRGVQALVNGQRDVMLSRIDQLEDALRRSGAPVPTAKEKR